LNICDTTVTDGSHVAPTFSALQQGRYAMAALHNPRTHGRTILLAGAESYEIALYPVGTLNGRSSAASPLTSADTSFHHRPLLHDGNGEATTFQTTIDDGLWFRRPYHRALFRLRSCTPEEWRQRVGMYFVPVFARPVVLVQSPVLTAPTSTELKKAIFIVPGNPEKHRFIPTTDKSLVGWWATLLRYGYVQP
jgi:hypothetical protein